MSHRKTHKTHQTLKTPPRRSRRIAGMSVEPEPESCCYIQNIPDDLLCGSIVLIKADEWVKLPFLDNIEHLNYYSGFHTFNISMLRRLLKKMTKLKSIDIKNDHEIVSKDLYNATLHDGKTESDIHTLSLLGSATVLLEAVYPSQT